MSEDYEIGVIGGSGLYAMDGLEVHEERRLETPFGDPSDPYVLGELEGRRVAFLARHGRGHRLMPTELNFRANVYGFKLLGCREILSVSAVGSMKLEYAPTHVVVPDQFFDRTRHRVDTFFGDGLVAHVSLADPVCPALAARLADAAAAAGAVVHRGGTYLCMEGPQFSTRAESRIYRQWGVDVIGMTNLQEARLAREAEICYATLAMVTDYDCWHDSEDDVSVDGVLEVLRRNARMGQEVVRRAVSSPAPGAGAGPACSCGEALRTALITDLSAVPAATLVKLAPIVGRYLEVSEPA
jgi:5'-methylthioadenosine phosphorylase